MTITYANGFQESRLTRLQRILPLLVCPRCAGALLHQELQLVCQKCNVHHPIRGGVPILLPAGVQDAGAIVASAEDRVSRHPYSARAEEIIAAHAPGWVLDLGAGGKLERRENVVQIDIFRYPSVDVVGSADCLPFGDNSFDAVISQAVFEHLQYPEWAVSEVRRVLKPGGIAKIDTAFLQPEHGYPHHFFNATETGLLHWFRDFDIEWSGIEPFQHPKWALHWFLGVYLDYVGEAEAAFLRQLTVGDLIDALQRHASGKTNPDDLNIARALDAIPSHLQRVLAAGVSVHAINPPKHDVITASEGLLPLRSLDREREMAQLRAEKTVLTHTAAELQERLKVAQDKAQYLAQFYPNASNVTRLAALWACPPPPELLPRDIADPRAAIDQARPFATLMVCPTAIAPLLDTFFSLTNQTFGGWELVLLTDRNMPAGVARAVEALCELDQRVFTAPSECISAAGKISSCTVTLGEYWIRLPEGATLAFNALEEVVTLARNMPGIMRIGFDFDRVDSGEKPAMRCHTQLPSDADTGVVHVDGFDSSFRRSECEGQQVGPSTANGGESEAHIFLSLVRLDASSQDENAPLKASYAYLLEQNLKLSAALSQGVLDNIRQMGLLRWARRRAAGLLRKSLPPAVSTRFLKWGSSFFTPGASGSSESEFKPFASFFLEPETAEAVTKTFFSLVQQHYSGWELLLIARQSQSREVGRAIEKCRNLDSRVVVIDALPERGNRMQFVQGRARGDYVLQLVGGVTLQANALEEVVTLAQARTGTDCIVCDFDVARSDGHAPMRCYNFCPAELGAGPGHQGLFDAKFIRVTSHSMKRNSASRLTDTAYIPLSLFHF